MTYVAFFLGMFFIFGVIGFLADGSEGRVNYWGLLWWLNANIAVWFSVAVIYVLHHFIAKYW